jgi:transcriptional accessory protein Tex/SPT6
MDIIAEEVSDHADLRGRIKNAEENSANVVTKATKTFNEE